MNRDGRHWMWGTLLLCLALAGQARADALPDDPPLRASPMLEEHIPAEVRPQLPLHLRAGRMQGQLGGSNTLEGGAELRRGDTLIRAERIEYLAPEDKARASGAVRVRHGGNLYRGDLLELEMHAGRGFFERARYHFAFNGAWGRAARVDFVDRTHAVVHEATYTTCRRTDWEQDAEALAHASWQPDWVLRVRRLHLDMQEEVGVAEGAALQFKGVTVLPVPWLSFPLTDKRRSGLLPPTLGLAERSGLEYTQPWYWNIAPQYDMTLLPTLLARRGAHLGAEFRHLHPGHSGEIYAAWMPHDNLRGRARWARTLHQRAALPGDVSLQMHLHRVSDDDYWRDFSHEMPALRERLLASDLRLHWSGQAWGGAHSVQLRMQSWQTLQDRSPGAAAIEPPYALLPQLQWRHAPEHLPLGLRMQWLAESGRFSARGPIRPPDYQPGRRSLVQMRLSRPVRTAALSLTPQLQLHSTHYRLDSPLPGSQHSATRTLPTWSLDGQLVLERDAHWFGSALLQTLEPRAFYTFTPYRDQDRLPRYDTARRDFNLTSIYQPNDYGGHDRMADKHSLTLGLGSQLLDAASGARRASFTVAQRLRLASQRVRLPGEVAATSKRSDLLLGGGLQWSRAWGMEFVTQYNRDLRRSVRSTAGAHYSPGSMRTLNVAWRAQHDPVQDEATERFLDLGWQWPVPWTQRRWYGMGRINYSIKDRKAVDTVLGVEFDGCCWVGRVVLERLQNSLQESNTRIMLQIELSGLSRLSLGADPRRSLRQNVPRYEELRRQVQPAGRFTHYE